MALGWKDMITTLLIGATAWLYFANISSVGSFRVPILLLGVLGIAMCAFSGGNVPASGAFMVITSTLGIIALIIIVYGLITGAKIAFIILAFTVFALWLISTFRHVIAA